MLVEVTQHAFRTWTKVAAMREVVDLARDDDTAKPIRKPYRFVATNIQESQGRCPISDGKIRS